MCCRPVVFVLVVWVVGVFSGCLPVAWVLPPTQFDFGAGPAVEASPNEDSAVMVLPFSASILPLGFLREHHERRFDAGLGYRGLVLHDRGQLLHAPFLEATYLSMPVRAASSQRLRLGAGGRGYMVLGHESVAFMPTLGLRAVVEFAGHVDKGDVECEVSQEASFCGYSRHYGERSVGIFAEGQSSLLPEVGYRALYVGLVLRVPASVGAGFVSGF